MAITVASWNIRDGLMQRSVREAVLSLGADIVVLPEAYAEADHGSAALKEVLRHIGETTPYYVHRTIYGDDDGRVDRHGMVVLIKRSLSAYPQTIYVGRRMVKIKIGKVLVVAVHLDDRRDTTRWRQFGHLQAHISGVDGAHVAIVGDFNVTHSGTLLGWLLRRLPLRWLPVGEPGRRQTKMARLGSLLTRLRGMTSSWLMDELARLRFEDADPRQRPTMLLLRKMPLVQLDHIMVRDLKVTEFRRLKLAGSDHLPIVAVIETP